MIAVVGGGRCAIAHSLGASIFCRVTEVDRAGVAIVAVGVVNTLPAPRDGHGEAESISPAPILGADVAVVAVGVVVAQDVQVDAPLASTHPHSGRIPVVALRVE